MRYFSRDDVFLSSFSRSSEEQLARQKQKRAYTRLRTEFVRRVLSFFPSLIQNGGGRGNQFPLLFSLIFPYLKAYLKEGPFLDFFLIFFFRLKKKTLTFTFFSLSLSCACACVCINRLTTARTSTIKWTISRTRTVLRAFNR